jgi:hypothetical protein
VTPAWILDILAALMLAVAAVSAARVATARPWRHGAVTADTDVAHLLMAVAMAGMLVPGLGILPDVAWEVVFALLAAWFVVRVIADASTNGVGALAGGHCAPHLVHSGSMLYMFLAASPPAARAGGMGGMPGGPGSVTMALSHPTLALVFAFVLVGYAIWDLDQLSGRRYAVGTRVSLAGAGAVGAVGMSVPAGAQPPPADGPGTMPGDTGPVADLVTRAAGERAGIPAAVGHADSRPGDEHAAASRGVACAGGSHPGGGGFLRSPAVTVGGRITMGITMAFMLLIAL